MNKIIVLFLVSYLFFFGCKETEMEADIIELDKTECIANRDGGEFNIKVLNHSKNLNLASYSSMTKEELQLYISENNDTLQTKWYKAVLIRNEQPIIKLSVFPNKSLSDWEDCLGIYGDNCSAMIKIKQSAF